MSFFNGLKSRSYAVYSLVFLIILVLIFLAIFFVNLTLTGKVILSVPSALPGKVIEGSFELNTLYMGRAAPLDTVVVATYGDKIIKSLYLRDLLSPEYISENVEPYVLFAPDVVTVIYYYPFSYFDQFPDNPNYQDETPTTSGQSSEGGINPGGIGGVGGGGISGAVISEEGYDIFSKEFKLRYGADYELPTYSGYVPVVYSATVGGKLISRNYVILTNNQREHSLRTTYYEYVQGIPVGAPPAYFELNKFRFIAKESSPITISLLHLAQPYFSASTSFEVKNVAPLNFDANDRVIVSSEQLNPEVVVSGDPVPREVSIGQTITPDSISVGCTSYTCSPPSECSIPTLNTFNRGALIPVRISYCKYSDCGISFQVTSPCEVPADDISVEKVDNTDLGIPDSGGSGEVGGGSSVALLDQNTRDPRAIVTHRKGSLATDVVFLQSPPNFGDACRNGVLDSGEEDIDCGGQCMSCYRTYPDYSVPAVWLAVCVLGFLLFIMVFRDRDKI